MTDLPRPRPRFEVDVPFAPDEVAARVRAALDQPEARLRGRVYRRVVQLEPCEDETHFWSPHLDVSLQENDGGTRLFGRFAPHPAVWTGFIATQAVIGFLGLCAGVYGASQWMLGRDPWALWLLALCVLAGAIVYLFAYVGQSLGQSQMYGLRAFLDRALEIDAGAPAPAAPPEPRPAP